MRAELSEKERKEMVFDPDQELPLYLRALADRHVFDMKVDPSERLKDVKRFEDVLQTAIGLEKDSVVFYTGMKAMVPKHLGGARLDDIIAEEMGHMATLGDLIRCAKR
jgi:rubrerythrin